MPFIVINSNDIEILGGFPPETIKATVFDSVTDAEEFALAESGRQAALNLEYAPNMCIGEITLSVVPNGGGGFKVICGTAF